MECVSRINSHASISASFRNVKIASSLSEFALSSSRSVSDPAPKPASALASSSTSSKFSAFILTFLSSSSSVIGHRFFRSLNSPVIVPIFPSYAFFVTFSNFTRLPISSFFFFFFEDFPFFFLPDDIFEALSIISGGDISFFFGLPFRRFLASTLTVFPLKSSSTGHRFFLLLYFPLTVPSLLLYSAFLTSQSRTRSPTLHALAI